MASEKKTLIIIAIEGQFEPQIDSKQPWKHYGIDQNRHLLLYGVEKRQENDAEKALQYSIQLRSPLLKIFVTQDPIIIEDGTPRLDWLAYWEQMFTLLNKNEIAASLDLVRIYRRVFDFQARKKSNTTQFLLTGKKTEPSRIRGLQKKYSAMVGRKKELNTLLEVVEQSFEDQGQIASIIGEAGLGKTRLKYELIQELKNKQIRFHEGFFSLNSDQEYSGFRHLAQQILDQNLDTFSSWDLNDSESAFLRYFLHPEEKNSIINDINEKELEQGIFNSVQKLLSNTGKQPTVLILDDFHWADEKSIQLMNYLSQSMEKTKIAFFLVHRPTFIPDFKRRLNYHQIKLSPLRAEETKELVKNVLHLDYVADRALDTLTTLSLGNPLYVEEILRELISQKKIEIDKEQDLVRLIQINFPEGSIPTNVQSLIVSRFDVLPKVAREIVQWTCAFGFRENHDDFELFLHSLELSPESFQLLFEQGYLEEASMFPEHKYKFCHDLLYETIRQSIPDRDWVQRNQRIAEFLYELYRNEMINHSDRVAEFFLKGRMDGSSFAPIFEAAKIALEQRRYSNSVKYFDEAYKLYNQFLPEIGNQELFVPYLEALFAVGNKERFSSLIHTWERSGFYSPEAEIKYYHLYMNYLHTYRQGQKLFEVSLKALQQFQDQRYEKDRIQFQIFYCHSLFYLSRYNELIHTGLKLLRSFNNLVGDTDDAKINLYYTLGFALQYLGQAHTASYYILVAKDVADRNNNFRQKILIHKRIGSLATLQGYYKEAVRIWSDLMYNSDQIGYLTEKKSFETFRILNNYFLGNHKSVIEDGQFAMSDVNQDWFSQYTIVWLNQSYLSIGAFDKTLKSIRDFRFFPQRDFLIDSVKTYFLGDFHFQMGDYRRAELNYRRARKIFEKNKQDKYVLDMSLHELQCKLLQDKISVGEAAKQFDWITSHESMRKYYYLWNSQMLSFFFARMGCNIRFKPSEDIDPMTCNASHVRMQMFVEKIKWLRYIGKNDEAEKLKEQYLKHRTEMAFYVPDEYKESYLNHPFYQV